MTGGTGVPESRASQTFANECARRAPRSDSRWVFRLAYIALVPYLAFLMLRHRSMTVFTAANPGITCGGALGESKSTILRQLARHANVVAEFGVLAPESDLRNRARSAMLCMQEAGLAFPVVMKPDVGERGWGVALIESPHDLKAYLACVKQSVIVQRYIEGVEAGIFYCRHPDRREGSIVSIAQMHHRRTSRLFGYASRFKRFTDAREWVTPQLAHAIDVIGRSFPAFYFGRFDVRAASVDALLRGDFRIIELNGVLAEAIHTYDPSASLADTCLTLFRRSRTVFSIGARNRARGATPTPLSEFCWLLLVKLWTVGAASRRQALARVC